MGTQDPKPPRLTRAERQVAAVLLAATIGLGVAFGVWSAAGGWAVTDLCGDGPPCAPGITYINDRPCWSGPGEIGGNGSPRPSGLEDCFGR